MNGLGLVSGSIPIIGISVQMALLLLLVVVAVWVAIAYALERDMEDATERAVGGMGGIIAGAVTVLVVAGETLAGTGSDILMQAPNFVAELGIIALGYGVIEGWLGLSGQQFVAVAGTVIVLIGVMRYS